MVSGYNMDDKKTYTAVKENRISPNDILLMVLVFTVSLTIRIVFLSQLKDTPLFNFFATDSSVYDGFALMILKGKPLIGDMLFFNALYPYFLACVYRIFGHNVTSVVIVQSVLDSVTCILIYLISLDIFRFGGMREYPESSAGNVIHKVAAFIAAAIYAVYSMAIFYAGFVLDTTLVVFLNVLFFFFLLRGIKGKKASWSICGAVLALVILLKPGILIFISVFVPIALFTGLVSSDKSSRIKAIAFLSAGCILVLLPFSYRTFLIDGRFSPFPVHGGVNFYVGMNYYFSGKEGMVGGRNAFQGLDNSPIKQIRASIKIAEKDTGRELTPAESSGYWFMKGLRSMKERKRDNLLLLFWKSLLFWNKGEHEMNLNYYFCRNLLPLLRYPWAGFGIVAPFALLGLGLLLRYSGKEGRLVSLFILSGMATVIFSYVGSRLRMPFVPFMAICSGYAVGHSAQAFRAGHIKRLNGFAVIVIILFFIVNADMYNNLGSDVSFASSYTNLGIGYRDDGMLREAIKNLKKAVEIDEDYLPAHYNLGIAYDKKGMLDEAIAHFEKVLEEFPEDEEVHFQTGLAYFKKGDPEKALYHYNKALEVQNDGEHLRNNIGLVYLETGRPASAVPYFKKAIELDPDLMEAHFNLALAYDKLDRFEEAISGYEKTLVLDPDFYKVHERLATLYYYFGKDREKALYHARLAYENGIPVDPVLAKDLLGETDDHSGLP